MALKPVSVTQLNEYISRVLMTDPLLGNISVTGEISNLKFHSSGHVYFSIIDETSKINCFLPSTYVRNLNYALGDGLEVIIHGYINVYKKGGTYTLFVRSIEVAGEGNLSMAFELLKKKLDSEGLFDSKYKKPIPKFPKKIGIVTSETGAAVRDILKIIKSRTKMVDVYIFPVLVQGPEAARDIAKTLEFINNKYNDLDVLILGRGGGSTEDLWAFNEEILARAVFASKVPIISAVGHEIDFTICDFVADLRAETPTAAAEKATPDDSLYSERIDSIKIGMVSDLNNKLAFSSLLCEKYLNDMKQFITARIDKYSHKLEQLLLTLEENNPSNILSKGYAILEDKDGTVISSTNEIKQDTTYKLHLKDGIVEFTMTNIVKEGD
ncbi:MAG: exodeoxyribonuclease VII large subunit [Firmicutes bacterium]|nr:exodeoxyribonuclease VII large subunit [Bacillota bacterium]